MTLKLRDDFPAAVKVNRDPFIAVFDDYLADIEIETLKKLASTQFREALVSGGKSGVLSAGRTGQNCWIKHHENKVISELSSRVSELVGIPLKNAESLQMIHYDVKQEYAAHFDAWDSSTERGQRCMVRGGQRLVTCLMYLNDVESGGGTVFPKLDLEVRARRGRMMMFYNCHTGTNQRHPHSLHGGLPVERGEKWACNFWFREKVFQIPSAKKSSNKKRRII